MRRTIFVLLIAVVVCVSLLGVAIAKRPKATWSVLATLPERIRVVRPIDGDYLVAAGTAGLLRVAGATGEVTPLFELKGLQVIDLELADGVAHLLTYTPASRRSDLYLIDPGTGNFMRSIALGGGVTDLAGFLTNGRLVVIQGVQVRFLEVATGRTRTRDRVRTTGGILNHGHLDGNRLYVARSYAGGLAVIDTFKRRLLEMIDTEPWLTDVQASGRIAYVDVKDKGMGVVNLDSRTYNDVEFIDVKVSPEERVFALDPETLIELDDQGQWLDRCRLPGDMIDELQGKTPFIVAVVDDHAVIAVGERLFRLDTVWKRRKPVKVAKAPPG